MTTYYNYLGQPMPVSGDFGSNTLSASGPGQTLTAPQGPSALYAYDSSGHAYNNDTFIGSNGDNTFYVNNYTDVVTVPSGLSGIKSIVCWGGGYILPANVQNLTFFGAGQWGVGNSGSNLIIMGGNDHATMDGGGGNDVLVGGFGENDYQLEVGLNGGSHDVIYNFHANLDTVRISGSGFTSFAQIQSAMQQVGSDVVLTIDGNDSITFRNITIAAFTPQNFMLPLDTSQLGAMTFDDEFNSLQLWNGSTGQWQTNFGGDLTKVDAYTITSNNEKQLYTAPNFVGQDGWNLSAYNPFSINNGVLDITAREFSYADSQHTWGQAYASGMLNSRGLFMQQYGFFEMRAALPTDLGSWPAFWMGQDPWNGAEADILEHLALYPNIDFQRANDAGNVTGHTTYIPALSGFHNYGMLWTPTTTTFYIDDLAVMSLPTPASWSKPMYMILDMAIGGWGGPIDNSALPAQMQVDWVHVYGLANTPVPVSVGTLTYTAPTGVNSITLIGSGGQTVAANNAGDAIISNNASGNHLIGGTGRDTITLGGGGDTATGGGGADAFLVNALPTTASTITDFASDDQLDLTALLSSLNYTGSNPIADGYVKVASDASGNAQVWAKPATAGAAWSLIATLDGVAASALHMQGDVAITGNGSTATQGEMPDGLLWRDDGGDVSVWTGQSGSTVAFSSQVLGVVPTTWTIAGTGDFNGDGHADMLWRNDNGDVSVWLGQSASGAFASQDIGVVPTSWTIAGSGDFNGDGHADMLWRNDNGDVSVWLGQSASGAFASQDIGVVPTSWSIAGTGDFNGDGKTDVLWRNANGDVSLRTAQSGSSVSFSAQDLGIVPTSWMIAATGDFNGDGKTDIIWRNDNGDVSIWASTGSGAFTSTDLGVVPTSWHVQGVIDVNGDGRADTVWRNDNGDVSVWTSQSGSSISFASQDIGNVPTSWHIQSQWLG